METTLYNKSGTPQVYIANDKDNSIYLWNGQAVAYLRDDKVYGWNGKHLGWYIKEIMYDSDGLRIGFTKRTCPSITRIQPIKSIKKIKKIKSIRSIAKIRPVLSLSYSREDLDSFLKQGI